MYLLGSKNNSVRYNQLNMHGAVARFLDFNDMLNRKSTCPFEKSLLQQIISMVHGNEPSSCFLVIRQLELNFCYIQKYLTGLDEVPSPPLPSKGMHNFGQKRVEACAFWPNGG